MGAGLTMWGRALLSGQGRCPSIIRLSSPSQGEGGEKPIPEEAMRHVRAGDRAPEEIRNTLCGSTGHRRRKLLR